VAALFGIATFDYPEHETNALTPMSVTLFGKLSLD